METSKHQETCEKNVRINGTDEEVDGIRNPMKEVGNKSCGMAEIEARVLKRREYRQHVTAAPAFIFVYLINAFTETRSSKLAKSYSTV